MGIHAARLTSRPWPPDRWLFAGLVVLHLLPVWSFSHFLTQDGPAHMESANVLRLYGHPDHALFRTVYALNPSLEPNLLGHLLAAWLLRALPVAAAEKLLVSLYVVGLPLSARYALHAVEPRGNFLVALFFPFVFNWVLYLGFYNFVLSLPLFFFCLGFWWRHRERLGGPQIALLAAVGLLLCVSHVVSFVMVLVVLATLAAWLAGLDVYRGKGSALVAQAPRLVLALAPALLLLGSFLARRGGAPPRPPSTSETWAHLRGLDTLVVFRDSEGVLASLLFWGLVLLATSVALSRRNAFSPTPADGWLLAAAMSTAVLFAAPRGMAGGAALPPRLILFPPWLLLIWLAAHPFSPRARKLVQGTGALFALAFLALRLPVQRALDAQLQEYLSVRGAVREGAIVLPLCYQRKGIGTIGTDGNPVPAHVDPFIHAAGYLAAEKNALQLANYEGNKGHFPTLFRPEWNPYTRMGPYSGIEAEPPCVDFLGFARRVGRPIDAVLTWGLETYERRLAEAGRRNTKVREAEACLASVREQLREAYELVDVSEPSGLARLYERRR